MGSFLDSKRCLIDLHMHLDGSISVEAARKLAAMQNLSLPEGKALETALRVSPDCRDLNEYLTKFALPLTLLQTKAGIAESVYLLLEELKAEGVIYAETRFAPQLHCDKGLTQADAIEAAIEGLKRSGLPGGLILCCMRGGDTKEANLETVRLAAEYLNKGVFAVDLAGAEAIFPTEDYEEEFALARQLQVPYTIHAGEADGPDSVRKALSFGTKRIGHGVRCVEDPELVAELAAQKILLECCPTSNLQTQIFPDKNSLPFRKFLDAGLRFTINTDNISVSGTSLRREWALVIDTFHLTEAEVMGILLNAADGCFAGEDVKENLRKTIREAFA